MPQDFDPNAKAVNSPSSAVREYVDEATAKAKAAEATLLALKDVHANTVAHLNQVLELELGFHDLLDRAKFHQNHKSSDQYVLFWTAVEASRLYAQMALRDTSSEDFRTGTWIGGWNDASSAWPASALNELGVEKGILGTRIARVGSSKHETTLGSDVVLMLCCKVDDEELCYVMNIQFKLADEGNRTLNVKREKWRQFSRLVETEAASKGRIQGWYGLLRNVAKGMDSVCLVELADAAEALKQDPLNLDPKREDYSFIWTSYAQTLSSAILDTIANKSELAYRSPAEALSAISKIAGEDLTTYVLVQAVGCEPMSLNAMMDQLRELVVSQQKPFLEMHPKDFPSIAVPPESEVRPDVETEAAVEESKGPRPKW